MLIPNRVVVPSLFLLSLAVIGCGPTKTEVGSNRSGGTESGGAFSDAELIDAETDLGQKACELVLPFARAIANRDYAAAYDLVDPMVFGNVHAGQFVRQSEQTELKGVKLVYLTDPNNRIGNVDKAKFVELMTAEDAYGVPNGDFEVIEEWNFEEEGEKMSGVARRYRPDFPFEKVVASVTVPISFDVDDAARARIFERYGVTETQGDDLSDAYWDCNIFVLVIRDGGELNIAFVDFNDMHYDQ